MAYRVLSKSTYHSICCASLPMAAPCALFSRWTSRTLEGQKWCLGRVEDLRGRRGKKASYYIIYHKFQHENTSKTAGTSHVPKSWASLLFKTIISACPRRNLFQICMDPLSTRYQASNYYHCLIDPEARMGTRGTPRWALGSGFPPVAFFRSIRKGIQHGRAGNARRKAA